MVLHCEDEHQSPLSMGVAEMRWLSRTCCGYPAWVRTLDRPRVTFIWGYKCAVRNSDRPGKSGVACRGRLLRPPQRRRLLDFVKCHTWTSFISRIRQTTCARRRLAVLRLREDPTSSKLHFPGRSRFWDGPLDQKGVPESHRRLLEWNR
jgi:hypothetical protein